MNEYDEGRIWFKKKGRSVWVGLTEKALEEIGGIQSISLPSEGDEFLQDDVVGEIEGEKVAFEIIAPIDGTVVVVNELLSDDHEILESDPLDEGWIFKLQLPKNDEDEDDDSDE
jgi:glycine cleavage system H protein